MVARPTSLPIFSAMKTVLITGCSSGAGLETARHFHAQGWNVVATMRTPREDVLPRSERLRVLALDVTRPESIAAAVAATGPIDVLVNNAGIGLFGAFEATPLATMREVFETSTFGVMAMIQAVVPQFRARRAGVVVNVTSSATLAPMPMVAVYIASKMAIDGFTASLAFELEAFDVRVKLVEPGYGPTTRFTSNSGRRMDGLIPEAYAPLAQRIFTSLARGAGAVTTESDVAEAVQLHPVGGWLGRSTVQPDPTITLPSRLTAQAETTSPNGPLMNSCFPSTHLTPRHRPSGRRRCRPRRGRPPTRHGPLCSLPSASASARARWTPPTGRPKRGRMDWPGRCRTNPCPRSRDRPRSSPGQCSPSCRTEPRRGRADRAGATTVHPPTWPPAESCSGR